MRYLLLLLIGANSYGAYSYGDCLKKKHEDYWQNGYYHIMKAGTYSYLVEHCYYAGNSSCSISENTVEYNSSLLKTLEKFECPK